jgi:hypoxanthine phosphoribosyltransferase
MDNNQNTSEIVKEIMNWQDVGHATQIITDKIHSSGYKPDAIIAIARGGLIIGGTLGYALKVKNLFSINVEFYTGINKRLPEPRILSNTPDLSELEEANILIADDVADTGTTFAFLDEFFRGKVKQVRYAAFYEKPESLVKCDYVWKRTEHWIEFPWDK